VTDFTTALARWRVPMGFAFGIAVIAFARPTLPSLVAGGSVAAVGEMIRIWAAGHLEKGIEITSSGPYRFTRHPLYLGSAIIGLGIGIAAENVIVALLLGLYLGGTLVASIRHEEQNMRDRFGDKYDAYVESRTSPAARPFSFARAVKNKEHHAIAGLLVVALIFAIKAARHM